MKSSLSLSRRLFVAYILISVLPLILLVGAFLKTFENSMVTSVSSRLSSIADKKMDQVDVFVSDRLSNAVLASQQPQTREALAEFEREFKRGGIRSEEYQRLDKTFRSGLEYIQDKWLLWDVILLDVEGNVVYTLAHEPDWGTNMRTGPYRDTELARSFDLSLRTLSITMSKFERYAPSNNRLASFVVAPVLDNGVAIGAIALQFDREVFESVITERSGLGRTGETLVAQREGDDILYTGKMRHVSNAEFEYKLPFDTARVPMQKALSGLRGEGMAVDYAGNEVVAAWRFLPALQWGMVVKIDADEALAPAYRLKHLLLMTSLLVLLGSGVLAYFFGKSVTRPLGLLIEGVDHVAQGDYSHRVHLSQNDELGRLAQAFNAMAETLHSLYLSLEQKVEDRTTALNIERERLSAVLNNVVDGIFTIDSEGRIESFNPAAERMFGYEASEVIGRNVSCLTPEISHGQNVEGAYPGRSVVAGGAVTMGVGQRISAQRSTGVIFPIELTLSEMQLGGFSRYVGVIRDVSDRIAHEVAQERMAAIIASSEDGIATKSLVGIITSWNPGAERIFGYTAAEVVGQPMATLFPPERQDEEPMMLARVSRGERVEHFETTRVTKDGRRLPVSVAMSPLRDSRGVVVGVSTIIRDISKFKAAEEAMLTAKKLAEDASQAKSEFLANMSHEIRTPMNAILGMTQLVMETALNPQQENYLRKAYSASRALLSILNDILDYSKLEAGRMGIEHIPMRVEEVLRQVGDLFEIRLEEKGLELFFDIDPNMPFEVLGDPMRLAQVLNNLMGNAIKFTERGEVRIRVAALEREGDRQTLRFSVSDTGIGLSSEQSSRLFRPFTQADNSITRKYGGTGLGLSICQRLVSLMGGEITVSGVEGQGSTFTFTIQVGCLEGTQAITEALDLQQISGLKVLVVDDQETSRVILGQLLKAWGLEVCVAESGEEALLCLEAADAAGQSFGAIVLDWHMPGMDGLEVARRIEENSQLRSKEPPLKIVMVTAHGKDRVESLAGDLHLDGVLNKPVVPSYLFDALVNGIRPELIQQRERVASGKEKVVLQRFDGVKVLLVEDNLTNQEVAVAFLQKRGVDVQVANHGGEAVSMVEATSFDLVLMDMHMPVMDGLEATRRIRQLPQGKDLPVVAMTAAVMDEDRRRCREVGMSDFVAKPIDPNELMACLSRWLSASAPQLGELGELVDAASVGTGQAEVDDVLNRLTGFDTVQALQRLDGDHRLYLRLLKRFSTEQAAFQEKLETVLQDGALDEAAGLLHSLRGLASNLGVNTLVGVAGDFENEIRAGQEWSSQAAFAAELQKTLSVLSACFAAGKDEAGEMNKARSAETSFDKAELLDFVEKLSVYVKQGELVPDELMQVLFARSKTDWSGKQLDRLIDQLDQFDHPGALETLRVITATLETSK